MIVQKLITGKDGKNIWVEVDEPGSSIFKNTSNPRNTPSEDLTIDGYISKHGGIFSHSDCKVYTTKNSYLDSLKAQGKTIMDW